MHPRKAIIIGSGIAGMATAIRLAVQGYEVDVFEKNNYPGGKLSAFEQDGFHFDAGPSLFTQPQQIEELFELAGEPIADYFSYRQVPVACRYFFADGKQVTAHADNAAFADELEAQLGEKKERVLGYLKQASRTYSQIGTIFLNHSLHKRKTWLHKRILGALAAVKPGHLFGTLHQHNSRHFETPHAVQLFNRYATYNGSNPYQAPGMLSLIPHLELGEGTFYPEGGMISITNAVYKLALKKGVRFHFDTPVQYIIHHEGKVRGVVVNDENLEADIVVSNGDVYFTYNNLLRNGNKATKLLKQERSSSAVIFYWGMKRGLPSMDLHNIFFSSNYKKEFDGIFIHKQLVNDPTVYINITSKLDPGHAPAGKENWFVMVNAPANTGQNWEELKTKLREVVIDKLSSMTGADIRSLIESEATLDPISIESKTASYMGSLYGTSSNSKLAAFLRHPNFSSTTRGLYFCGGSVHPGGGIPLCLKSARIVADLVAADARQQRAH